MDGLLLDTELLWHRAETRSSRGTAPFSWDDKMAVIGSSFSFTGDSFAAAWDCRASAGPALVDEM